MAPCFPQYGVAAYCKCVLLGFVVRSIEVAFDGRNVLRWHLQLESFTKREGYRRRSPAILCSSTFHGMYEWNSNM